MNKMHWKLRSFHFYLRAHPQAQATLAISSVVSWNNCRWRSGTFTLSSGAATGGKSGFMKLHSGIANEADSGLFQLSSGSSTGGKGGYISITVGTGNTEHGGMGP